MSSSRDHEIMRRQLWISVATATASASNCVNKSTVAGFADYALEKFDEKFKALPEETNVLPGRAHFGPPVQNYHYPTFVGYQAMFGGNNEPPGAE